jgi:DNA primase
VLVEGPMDAIAITLATNGTNFGVAPLGTSLTEAQARQLSKNVQRVTIATDADPAGRQAAERDFWLVTPHGIDPDYARLPDGSDPADLVTRSQGNSLVTALRDTRPLGTCLIEAQLTHGADATDLSRSIRILAASSPSEWAHGIATIAELSDVPAGVIRCALAAEVKAWNEDPSRAAAFANHTSRSPKRAGPRGAMDRVQSDSASRLRHELPPPKAESGRRGHPAR